MSTAKEKYTKEQMMRLLDRAIEQEESLLEKVKILEASLSDCRKKAENPRHEVDEQALPGSKVSFRLDYYRTTEKGPYKGIIQHLSTKESRSFEGYSLRELADFVKQFIGINLKLQDLASQPLLPAAKPVFPPEINEDSSEVVKKEERSPLLKKLFPEFFSVPTPPSPKINPVEPSPIPEPLESEPFLVLTEGGKTHRRTVRSGQPFQIQIPMQTLDIFQDKPCSVSLSAKSLEKKPGKSIEMGACYTPNQDSLSIPVRTQLAQGIYRLIVSMALRDEPNRACYREDRLLIVQ